ncbi:MAG: transcriptional repressor [Anaerolineae bacterium]|nr:transcriptional repressor [Anaerolineae bacterium]
MERERTRYDEMVEALRENGLRLTPQRMAVVKYLAENRDHPSVEQLYEAVRPNFPTTSLATIYKTVAVLEQIGEAAELRLGQEMARYDGANPHPHPHAVCTECGRVVDVDLDIDSGLMEQVEQVSGFQVETFRVDFFGVCPDCRRRQQ